MCSSGQQSQVLSFYQNRHLESQGDRASPPKAGVDVPSGRSQNGASPRRLPPHTVFTSFTPFFLPLTTCFLFPVLALGCAPGAWLQVLQGHKQGPCWCRAFTTGSRGNGCVWRGCKVLGYAGQGVLPGLPQSMVGQPPTRSGLCSSERAWEFGDSLLGSS